MMLTWRGAAAGCHAAYGMEGAGAITGEDTVHKHTGEVGYLLSRGGSGTHKNKWELKGGARITKLFFTLKIFKIIEKFGF